MHIKKTLIPAKKLKPLFKDASQLQFGRNFTDYMFSMEYFPKEGWKNPEIKPLQPLLLHPAANVLHYSQEVFEGQKAYKSPQGQILLFRPGENAKRINHSLKRMCMPEIPEDFFLQAESELLKLEERWIPSQKGAALYIRPTVIGTEGALGVRPSETYLFYIILSPTGPYFKEGFNPIGLWVSDTYTRAALGGTGEAKTGGNYSGSLLATQIAINKGYSQVLWLDASEHRLVEEVGAMNIFFVINNTLLTPELSGSILAGITRKSLLEMAGTLGIKAQERPITISEVIEGIQSKSLTEIFGAGTAAVISPVGKINYKDNEYIVNNNQTGPWAKKFFDTLTAIQYGEVPDPFGWVYVVK